MKTPDVTYSMRELSELKGVVLDSISMSDKKVLFVVGTTLWGFELMDADFEKNRIYSFSNGTALYGKVLSDISFETQLEFHETSSFSKYHVHTVTLTAEDGSEASMEIHSFFDETPQRYHEIIFKPRGHFSSNLPIVDGDMNFKDPVFG